MEKKLLKMILTGLGTILILAALYVWVSSISIKKESEVTVFVNKEADEIRSLSITNSYGSYEIYYDEAEEGYVFDDIPVNIVDFDGFCELLYGSCAFGSLKTITGSPEDLTLYGLDAPIATVEVQFSDGSDFLLKIGNKEKVSGNYYGMVNDEKTVYLFAEEDMIYFLLKKENYISYQVTPELQVTSPLSAVRDITFSGSALEKPITITAVTDADSQTKLLAKSFGPATHIVQLKGVYELDQTYGIEILGSVLGIQAIGIAGYNLTDEDLTEMGFDDPYFQVDFALQNGTDYIADYQLKLIPYGEYYLASMKGTGVVYIIEAPEFLSIDYTKLCMRWFLAPLRSDLEDITVEFDGKTFVYTSEKDEDGNTRAFVNGEEMDIDLFYSFYRLVTSAASDGLYLEDTENEGEPLMTITYHYAVDGKTPDVMKLYSGSLRRVNVEVNGITEFDMKSSFVDAMKTACEHTLTGESIEENWQ